jgi:hypothetical protein
MSSGWIIADHIGDKRLICFDRQTNSTSARGLIYKVLPPREPAATHGTALA